MPLDPKRFDAEKQPLGAIVSPRGWDALAERVGAPPFLHRGWVEAWARAFSRDEIQMVEARRSGELVAVMPMLRRGSRLRPPANWHTPLFGPVAADAAALDELFGELFDSGWASVELNLLAGSELETVCDAACGRGRRVLHRTVARSPFIPLDGSFEDYEGDLSRNRRKALRRHRKRLTGEGRVRFEVHAGGRDLDRLLEQVFAVEAAGWKGERGTAIASRNETRSFYTDVARWAADNGWLRLAFLCLDERPIACDFAILHDGVWYSLKAGFDEEFRSYGPGALLLRDEIAHCYEQPDVTRVELLGHEDQFKASWATDSTDRVWLKAFGGGPFGALSWTAHAARERMRPTLRRARSRFSTNGRASG
jgi:CelD/BcsL family acetyltransferase involved in cellulose biosynthesis